MQHNVKLNIVIDSINIFYKEKEMINLFAEMFEDIITLGTACGVGSEIVQSCVGCSDACLTGCVSACEACDNLSGNIGGGGGDQDPQPCVKCTGTCDKICNASCIGMVQPNK